MSYAAMCLSTETSSRYSLRGLNLSKGRAVNSPATQSSRMTARELLPLLALTLSAFLLNTSEFVPIGLLTDIAGAFGLSESGAGTMISVYAWAVALLSLPLMLAGSRMAPRGLIVAVLSLFCAGQVASAVAPTFELLVASRLMVAASHAVFWSVATPFAVRVVAPEHASVAMSTIVTGTSVAMIFGLPLGRALGLALGWRMTFACMATFAAAALLGIGHAVYEMFAAGSAKIGSLLMLFLYIEILSMVKGSRLGTREIPIHTPIALAIVAVARYLVVDVEHITPELMLYASGAILVLVIGLKIVSTIPKSDRH